MTNRHKAVNKAIATLATIDVDELAALACRVHAAIEIDDRNPSAPDGYPALTPGHAPSTRHAPPMAGPCRVIEAGVRCAQQRPCREHDTAVPLTPVEAAVSQGRPADPTANFTRAAVDHLVAAAASLELARRTIAELETIRRHPLELTGHCEALAGAGGYETAHRTTFLHDDPEDPDLPGTAITLGRWAYDHLHRAGRLPTRTEALTRMSGHRVTPS